MQRRMLPRWMISAVILAAPALAAAQPAPPVTAPPVTAAPVTAAPMVPVAPPATTPAVAGPLPLAAPAAVTGRSVALREIDGEMTTLSNDLTAAHTRLQQLTATVLSQIGGGGAQLIIEHQNDMGSTFRLARATYSLDGTSIGTRTDENGSLAEQHTFPVFDGRITSGEHTLTVSLEYQGNGFGIFSYIRGYTFRARSVQAFSVPEGRALRLTVVGYERGGATTAVEERPAIRYTQQVMTIPEATALSNASVGGAAAAPAAR
ncbi:MAG: Dihydrolipoamide acetyltransferase [Myxococcaceae bacterium]|nr:Dihydrolipoamide acetyltransferase [Myxococcaceae bacterium]